MTRNALAEASSSRWRRGNGRRVAANRTCFAIAAAGRRVFGGALLVWVSGCGDGVGPLVDTAFRAVSAGGTHTCAIDVDGVAYCWGLADNGQLGDGGTGSRAYAAAVAADAEFVALSAGRAHTCGLAAGDVLYCWGSNGRGQVGDGSTADQPLPVPIGDGLAFAQVSSGTHHTCAVTTANEAYCWGANGDGQLGDGTTTDRATPVRVNGPSLTRVQAGGHHTCGLTAEGGIYCWGRNDLGQLGIGTTANRALPARVRRNRRYDHIATGFSHTCAIAVNQHVFCWGSNGSGELGLHWRGVPDQPGESAPSRVTTDIPDQEYLSIAAGVAFTCGIDTRRHGYCWGRGQEGQLGTGATRTWEWPRAVYPPPIPRGPGVNRFRNVSTGATHTCGTTTDEIVLCWGKGDAGQLGSPDVFATEIPVRVAGSRR